MGTRIMRIYGHGENGYMKDHVIAIYEEVNEAQNGQKIVMWDGGDVGENADWEWDDEQLVSQKYPSQCIAVYETGDGVPGDALVVWDRGDVGNNARWHKKKHDVPPQWWRGPLH